jgi:hypothetical protein
MTWQHIVQCIGCVSYAEADRVCPPLSVRLCMRDCIRDCETDHCLVVAQVRERLTERTFDVQRFNPQKLSELEVRNQHQTEISAGLQQLWKN